MIVILRNLYKLMLCFFVSLVILSCEKEAEKVAYSEMELEILELVNQYRLLNNLPIFEMNSFLYNEATEHTRYMIDKGEISHENSDERFKSIQSALSGNAFAENVAAGQKTAGQVVDAWLNSEGHRRNIEGNYNITGISAIRNEQGRYYYTQIFTRIP